RTFARAWRPDSFSISPSRWIWKSWKWRSSGFPPETIPSKLSCRTSVLRSRRHRHCSPNGLEIAMRGLFQDRKAAGRYLAEKLSAYGGRDDVLVLALPRGGVPVGFEVAKALDAPLDVYVVRKVGVPGYEELAMGAVASGGVRVLNHSVIESLEISDEVIEQVA